MLQVHGLSPDGKQIILNRFECLVTQTARADDVLRRLLVVDVETTGLDPLVDDIIEFAAADLRYTDDGRIVQHHGTYSWFQDPGRPIPREVVELTGITDEMVRGEVLPRDAPDLIDAADMIVSHNAAFDWRFCYKRWPASVKGTLWGCSLKQIDWDGMGFPSARQEVLARYHGFFYDAHRATEDVEALTNLLQMRPAPDRDRYLASLIKHLAQPRYRVLATGTPFECKDELKQRRYRWDPDRRVWWTSCGEEELAAEREWLDDLYGRYRCRGAPSIKPIDPRQQWA